MQQGIGKRERESCGNDVSENGNVICCNKKGNLEKIGAAWIRKYD